MPFRATEFVGSKMLLISFHSAAEFGACYDCPVNRPRDYKVAMLTIRHGGYGGVTLRYCKEHFGQFREEVKGL